MLVVNLDGNIPSVHINQDKAVLISVDRDVSDIESDQSCEELQQHTLRRSKRVTKLII